MYLSQPVLCHAGCFIDAYLQCIFSLSLSFSKGSSSMLASMSLWNIPWRCLGQQLGTCGSWQNRKVMYSLSVEHGPSFRVSAGKMSSVPSLCLQNSTLCQICPMGSQSPSHPLSCGHNGCVWRAKKMERWVGICKLLSVTYSFYSNEKHELASTYASVMILFHYYSCDIYIANGKMSKSE